VEISLALGGGGSKGIAHIGVLLCLEKHDIHVRAIAGTSAGGIIAAILAAGYTPRQILERFIQIDQTTLYGRRPGDWPAILGVAGINKVLQEMLGDRLFNDLVIPCALTAVDLESEKEVILTKGRVLDAVMGTISLPGVFPPHPWEGRHLLDGGLLDPVPVVPARRLKPELPVVAVVLSDTEPQPLDYLEPPIFLSASPILKQLTRLRVAQAFNIFLHSVDISSRYMTQMKLEQDRPDVIVNPDLKGIGILDRVDVMDIVRRGEAAAEAALPEIRRSDGLWQRMKRVIRGSNHS
jgi:NTE family protein